MSVTPGPDQTNLFALQFVRAAALARRRPARGSLLAGMARKYFPFVAAALVHLLLVGNMTGAATPAPSGIEGVISFSPSRPGPIRKDEPNVAPARNLEFVVKKGDATVASFTTDGEGGFRVSLPPGHYVVMREDAGAAIGHWRFEVDVVPGEMAKVAWTGDSGMR